MEPNKIPVNASYRWIVGSLKMGERHYTLLLICGLIVYATSFIVSAIPYVGHLAYSFVTFLYTLAGLRLTQQLLQQKNGTVDDFLKYAFDPIYFQRHRIQLGLLLALGVLSFVSSFIPFTLIIALNMVLVYIATQWLSFSAFMMILSPEMGFKAALEKVIQGFTLNFSTWLLTLLMLVVFMGLSILFCLAPFLLYFVPMTFCVIYFIYASIFETFNIETQIMEWSSNPLIKTHTLPSDTE